MTVHEASNRNNGINSVDALNTVVILLLTVVVAFFRRQLGGEAGWLLGIYASLLAFILFSAFLAPRHLFWQVVHDFSPILIIIVVFNSVGPLIEQASPGRWDSTFD